MAKSCPEDLVRALVEGTLGVAGDSSSGTDVDDRLADVQKHLASCSSCRRLRAELEDEEKLIRAAVAIFGEREAPEGGDDGELEGEGDVCPPPAQLAAFAEGALEGSLLVRLEGHVASCGLCRASYVASTAPVMVEVRDDVLQATRLRLAAARRAGPTAAPVLVRRDSARTSARRKSGVRTGKHATITAFPSQQRGFGLVVAAAAAVLVALGLFAFHGESDRGSESNVAQSGTPSSPAPVARPSEKPAPVASSAPAPRESAAPVAPARPVETAPETPAPRVETPENPVIASNDTARGANPADDEEDPAEDDSPRGPRGVGPANSARPQSPAPSGSRPSTPAPTRRDPVGPTGPALAEKGPATGLACSVASIQGTVELHKKDAKVWRTLTLADTVEAGDAIRAKGVDSGFTFVGRARVLLDAEASGVISYEGSGVAIALSSGSVEGESLARYGLKISDANGTVSAWKGAKVRVESLPDGLRVCVDEGKARIENALGHCVVGEGREAVVTAQKEPRVSSHKGPRRTARGR